MQRSKTTTRQPERHVLPSNSYFCLICAILCSGVISCNKFLLFVQQTPKTFWMLLFPFCFGRTRLSSLRNPRGRWVPEGSVGCPRRTTLPSHVRHRRRHAHPFPPLDAGAIGPLLAKTVKPLRCQCRNLKPPLPPIPFNNHRERMFEA